VGHAGTLDPLATGILIVCIGSATRLVENLQDLPKTYRTLVRLGRAGSDTLDADGQIEIEQSPRIPSFAGYRAGPATAHRGRSIKGPPAYSAPENPGEASLRPGRARAVLSKLAPRRVRIDRIDVLHYDWPSLELEIDCGGGTYVRSIARDVGRGRSVAVDLSRPWFGPGPDRSRSQTRSNQRYSHRKSIHHYLRPAIDAVAGVPKLIIDAGQVRGPSLKGRRLCTQDLGAVPFADGQGRTGRSRGGF